MLHPKVSRTPRPTATDSIPGTEAASGEIVRFLFVGERPSPRAQQIGATLQNGKLSGKTLHDALRALKLSPEAHHFLNLYQEAQSREDAASEEAACSEINRFARRGYIVVGLGRLVSHRLQIHRIPHLQMIHPAARGAIRKSERYQEHVATTLAQAPRKGRCRLGR